MKNLLLKHLALLAAAVFVLPAATLRVEGASYKKPMGKDIGSFMERLHKGKTSYATLAKTGKLNGSQLNALAKNYRVMLNLSPPKNKQLWKQSVAGLINATSRLARSPKDPRLLAAYTKAVDCNSCHRKHR